MSALKCVLPSWPHDVGLDNAPVNRFTRLDALGFASQTPYKPQELHDALDRAVQSHLMGDVPYGLLISGGLDLCVAALAMRHAYRRVDDDNASKRGGPTHSFAIGLEGSPDLAAADVAKSIGTTHHGLTYTVQEGIDALSDVIKHIETYDVTTIRASTLMYLI